MFAGCFAATFWVPAGLSAAATATVALATQESEGPDGDKTAGSEPDAGVAEVAGAAVPEPYQVPLTVAGNDPAVLWPAPFAESQLAGDAVYFSYHRADGRSLLPPAQPERPLKIWAGGDSLSGGIVFGLNSLLKGNDSFDLTTDIRISSGHISDWFFDWPEYMATEVAVAGFDVIVLTIGGNDKQRFRGQPHRPGTPEWNEMYKERVRELIEAASLPSRLVVWVDVPPMRPAYVRDLPELVNPLVEEVIAEYPNAHYIATADVLTTDGTYTRILNGRYIRAADHIHYSTYGGELVSQPVLDEIARRSG